MKNLPVISFGLCLLLGMGACKKPSKQTLPQLNGSWTLVSTIPNSYIPYVSGRNIVATSSGLVAYGTGYTNQPVSYSSDHGVTWSTVFDTTKGPLGGVAMEDAFNNARLVTYSPGDSTFYLSTNGGQGWSVLSHLTYAIDSATGLYFAGVSGNNLFAVKYHVDTSTNPNSSFHLLKSSNSGNSWDTVANLNFLSGNVNLVSGIIANPVQVTAVYNELFFSCSTGGILSKDNGTTWLPEYGGISAFSLEGVCAGYMVGISTIYNQVCSSADTSRSWQPIQVPFTNMYNDLGDISSVLGFDSVFMVNGATGDYSMVCENITKGVWYAADAGLNATQGNIFYDSQYVYLLGSNFFSSESLLLYRRTKSDFAGL